MARIWRLEHKDTREGVYRRLPNRARSAAHIVTDEWSLGVDCYSGSSCPMPNADPFLGPLWDKLESLGRTAPWHFGFATLDQVRSWFPTIAARRKLGELGIVLRQYEVPTDHYRRGATQAIFIRDRERLIQERSPAEA